MKAIAKEPARTFLGLPADVRDRVYRELLCREGFEVGDWAVSDDPTISYRRTGYIAHTRKRRSDPRTAYTTYTVRDTSGELTDLNVMLVNRQIHEEAAKIFYGENRFSFLGTAEATLSFVHDRVTKLRHMAKISMIFSCDSSAIFTGCHDLGEPMPMPPRTNVEAWRRIFNLLVHASPGLKEFELIIDRGFWEEAPWTRSTNFVLEMPNLCNSDFEDMSRQEDRNFLQHVARLARITIWLTIDGSDEDDSREEFRKDMQDIIRQRAFHRPWLAEKEAHRCTCGRRYLKDSCVWDTNGPTRTPWPPN